MIDLNKIRGLIPQRLLCLNKTVILDVMFVVVANYVLSTNYVEIIHILRKGMFRLFRLPSPATQAC